MIITNITESVEIGQPVYRFLCSDFHLGSRCADHALIAKQLDQAKAIGARVLINGDVFDCIGSKDKRFDLAVLHPDLAQSKDLTGAIVKLAKDLLWPYREVIDLIGIGNHEESWINYNNTDPVAALIKELNGDGKVKPPIKHASVMGFIRTTFKVAGHRKRPRHKILYLHGTGGDSPVTKGTIDFNRKGRNWDWDVLTFGHKHNYVCAADQVAYVNEGGKYAERKQLALQTASYYRNYRELNQEDVLDYSYAQRFAHPPKPQGGIFLSMEAVIDEAGILGIEQHFASKVVTPWSQRRTRKAAC